MCFPIDMTTTRFKYLNDEQVAWIDEIMAFCNADTTGRFEGLADLRATKLLADSLMCDKSDAELVRQAVNNQELEDAGIAVGPVRQRPYHALVGRLGEEDALALIVAERRRRLRGTVRPSDARSRRSRR